MAVKYRVNGENGASVEYTDIALVPNGAVYETIEIFAPTEAEIAEAKRPQIEEIDKYYTRLISEFLSKWIERKEFGEITDYPFEIKAERDRLRDECNTKIAELGVDISTYRETKRQTILLKSLL